MTTRDFQTRSPMRIFLSYFRPHRGLFLLDMTCAFFISLVDLAFPLISRTAMYHWLPDKRYSVFFTVMAIVLIAFVIRSILFFVVCYWGHTFGIRVEADIRRDLFAHMQELGFDFYDKNRTGQLMSRLTTDLFELTELAHHGPEDLFISIVTIAGALAVMFTIQWRMALVVSVILPVFVLTVMHRRRQHGAARAAPGQAEDRRASTAELESGHLRHAHRRRPSPTSTSSSASFDGVQRPCSRPPSADYHKADGPVQREHGVRPAGPERRSSSPTAALLIMQERMDLHRPHHLLAVYLHLHQPRSASSPTFAEMFLERHRGAASGSSS